MDIWHHANGVMAHTDYTYGVGITTRNMKYPCLMGISKLITQSAKNRHADNVMRANHGKGLQQLVPIWVLPLAHWSSFWCCRCCCMSSASGYYGSFPILMTWCSLWTSKSSVFPSSRCGRLAWKVKGSMLTWRRSHSWSLVMTRMSSKNLASTPELSSVVVSANSILFSHCMLWVCKACNGITKQLVEDPNFICPRCKRESHEPINGWTVTEVDVDGTMLYVGA